MEQITADISKSLVIPVYNNEENISDLLTALENLHLHYKNQFEVIFVVDGSPDNSLSILSEKLSRVTFHSTLLSLSKNFGAFVAIRTGLKYVRGIHVAVMAADLQEPIELIDDFFAALEKNSADVVFGQRISRKDGFIQKILANSYWALYRRFINPEIPKGGVDIFACNTKVKDAVLSIEEPNSSLMAQLFWVGYRRLFIPYHRRERKQGKSAWNARKRIDYMLDSIFSYSDAPLQAILWLGIIGILSSICLGVITLVGKALNLMKDVPGYTTLVLGAVFLGSTILLTQGILGCYLWRVFENTKRRPISLVQEIKKYSKK